MKFDLLSRSCPICGSDRESHLFAEADFDAAKLGDHAFASRKLPEYMHLRLLECSACDLLYSSPAPAPGSLSQAYDEAAYSSGKEAAFAADTYIALVRKLVLPSLRGRNGALDIGAGDGVFLSGLRSEGFENISGIEPSAAPIAAAAADVKTFIRHDVFRPGSFDPDSMSLVTCFQTIEHVSDPLELCRASFEMLEPGGAFCIVGHNRRALSARLLGRKSPIFDIEHLQLFSRQSLEKMLAAAGFQRVTVAPVISKYPLAYWTTLFPMPSRVKQAVLSLQSKLKLDSIPIPLPAGNLVAVGFKPSANS